MSALQLEAAAAVLGPILDEVVFVGGATIQLWLTEPGAPPARATDDVDVICEVATRVEYYRLGSRLREPRATGGERRAGHLPLEEFGPPARLGRHADQSRHPRLLQPVVCGGDLDRDCHRS